MEYQNLGNFKEAIIILKTALMVNSENEGALYEIAFVTISWAIIIWPLNAIPNLLMKILILYRYGIISEMHTVKLKIMKRRYGRMIILF